MKTQKITLCFEEGSLLHSDKDLWYRGTDNVLTMEQKLKVINLIFSDQKKLSCSQLSSEEVIQKELEKSFVSGWYYLQNNYAGDYPDWTLILNPEEIKNCMKQTLEGFAYMSVIEQ